MKSTHRSTRSDLPTVALHWVLVVTLAFSLSTGLRISADSQDARWARALEAIALQGDVMRWHVWAAFTLSLTAIAYVVFIVRARLQSRLALDATRRLELRKNGGERRWRAINVLIYWCAFVLLGIGALTGAMLYFFGGGLPHAFVLSIHRAVAWLVMLYVFLHIAAQVAFGGWRQLLKILTPTTAHAKAGIVAGLAALLGAAALYAVDRAQVSTLEVASIQTPPTLDGAPDDSVWAEATPVRIRTARGANSSSDVSVTVRALHDGKNIYALFEWPDTTRSQKHLPLVKTPQGWKVMQKEYGSQDEDDYYEDKFGVMLSRSDQIAGSGTIHLGPRPLKDKRGPSGGRGLHYTTHGGIVDVWHWKSVRTGSPMMNQIDDNYFGPPLEDNPEKSRYAGGYAQDPSTGGGYVMNWESFDEDIVRPLRLPKTPSLLERLGDVDMDPNASDSGEFWLTMDDTVPYSEALDTYPVGTVMPSVLIKGQREGDRGNVDAFSSWADGRWHLEVSRKLDTDSEFDLALTRDQPTYLWVAVFDHAQTRHSIHLHPVHVVLE